MDALEPAFASGRTADIHPYGDGKVLKLFFPDIPRAWIDKEAETSFYIQDMHLPVPKVYERLERDGRQGLVYERFAGSSLLHELASKPWTLARCARLLARLHAQVHAVPAPPGLETQRDWARGGIPETNKLSRELREKVLDLLNSMPAGEQLCHGDFHPGNIMLTGRGPIIIDWMTASRGTGAGDVARTSIILEAAKAPPGTPMRWLLEWVRQMFHATYLETYFKLCPAEKQAFPAWRAVMAANFFVDVSLPEEEGNLMAIVEQGIRSVAGDGS